MKVSRTFGQVLMVLSAMMMALVGCASTRASKFYMLESLSGSRGVERLEAFDSAISVGLGPVSLPEYHDRPQIVTRTNENTVQLAEFDRWAGALSSSVSRILAENLTFLLNTDSVLQYPWPAAFDVTYQVLVDVYRFDGILGDKAVLDAQWSIVGKKGRKVLLLKKSTFVVPAGGPSFESLVSAQSRTLGDLSREIALALEKLGQDRAHD